MKTLKEMLMEEIITDEKEYCFDQNYCDNELWKAQNGSQTREEAFHESMEYFSSKTVEEILEFFGDKYNFVIERYNNQ